jgi:hypothetical protein
VAGVYLTIKQIEALFWRQTMTALGYDPSQYEDPDNPPASMPVRIAWPTTGSPAWKITEDVVFLLIAPVDQPINRQRHVTYKDKDTETATQTMERTRVIGVNWVLYGPNSFYNADRIRESLFGAELLSKSNIYLVPDIAEPRRAPELFEGRWWERVDLLANFNEYIKTETDVKYIESADITINRENGGVTIVKLEH